MKNLFEVATRNKFRFTFRGMVSVEDLWDLNLEQLDEIYKSLSAEKKKANEESLLKTKTREQEILEIKIEIVKHIVEIKLEEIDNRQQAKVNREQRQRILEILNEKESQDLKNKSPEELKAMLENL